MAHSNKKNAKYLLLNVIFTYNPFQCLQNLNSLSWFLNSHLEKKTTRQNVCPGLFQKSNCTEIHSHNAKAYLHDNY